MFNININFYAKKMNKDNKYFIIHSESSLNKNCVNNL